MLNLQPHCNAQQCDAAHKQLHCVCTTVTAAATLCNTLKTPFVPICWASMPQNPACQASLLPPWALQHTNAYS